MAFNIKVYAGSSSSSSDLFTKIRNALQSVFGYVATPGVAVTGDGWAVRDIGSDKVLLTSKGSDGLDDLNFSMALTGNKIRFAGFQFMDGGKPYTYGIENAEFGFAETYIGGLNDKQFWIYGNSDFIHILYRGYGVYSGANSKDTEIHIISFGKFIPTYNPSITHVQTIQRITIGSDVIIPVVDASIFEPNRYITISGATTWEKTLVTDVSYVGNTITVSNISQDHFIMQNGDYTHPIILGEMAKPYYIWSLNQQDVTGSSSVASDEVMLLPRLSGTMLSLSTSEMTAVGYGIRGKLFTQIDTLAHHSALDMLNYDRYMFEMYIYVDKVNETGFLGKLPYIYAVGSNDTNSESTIINDQYFLYRIFKPYDLFKSRSTDTSIAVREAYK